jgi:TolB-like protein/DNA-binding SARP family transcriptional activator/Flp pilus assembly protein TadD
VSEARAPIRLRMLGTLDLRDSQGREIRSLLRSPKLLALLTYLTVARPWGFHRRDTLVALLWPELDHAHARNALRQAVHTLRDALGPQVVLGRGEDELGIDEGRLWSDVRNLETALKSGPAELALELYRGELLSGLHVPEVPEFERWLDGEREHVRRRACEAAQLLATRDDAAGNASGAARWARRLTELSPSDEPAAQRLIELLHRSGDRSGAVRAYGEFEKRLARDLELEPSSETRTLVQAVRAPEPLESAATIMPSPEATASERAAVIELAAREQVRAPALRPAWRKRKRVTALLALAVAAFSVGGWFIVGARSAEAGGDLKRLVVLPFANLGTAEDAYFAAGVTEELTARLAVVDRLRVIGSTSANSYKGTNKTIAEIGKELGVDYIIEGSIRWQKSPGGPPRVRVTPQLVNTKDGTHLWAEIYDEPLDEIFRVQSDIAYKVVRALGIALLEQQRHTVETAPTRNLQAYDYFLRANEYFQRGTGEVALRAEIQMYEKALDLDPQFALAYAYLSRAHTRMYWAYYDRSAERLAKAKQALDKAFELEPDMPEVHHSLGVYYGLALLDYGRSLREFELAETRRPNDSRLFRARANVRTRQGNFPEALADFAKAWQLDPASSGVASNYAITYDLLRDYPRAEALCDRAIALAPDRANPYMLKIWMYLRWDGTTTRARETLDQAQAAGVAGESAVFYPRVMMDIYDRHYEDAIKLLSSEAREVVSSAQDRVIPRAQLYAQAYQLLGRPELARVYYDSARTLLAREIRTMPEDPRLHSALGIAYAGLGRKPEAIGEGLKAVELIPISKEAYKGYHHLWELARIYTMVGEYDLAVDRLEFLLSIPGQLTAAWLRMDPVFDPLRSHPRFQRLVERGT